MVAVTVDVSDEAQRRDGDVERHVGEQLRLWARRRTVRDTQDACAVAGVGVPSLVPGLGQRRPCHDVAVAVAVVVSDLVARAAGFWVGLPLHLGDQKERPGREDSLTVVDKRLEVLERHVDTVEVAVCVEVADRDGVQAGCGRGGDQYALGRWGRAGGEGCVGVRARRDQRRQHRGAQVKG